MILLYTNTTPNGYRASVILEETGLEFKAIRINTDRGEHLRPDFVALNPAAAIPVIVDEAGPGGVSITLPQSGAIVMYAAEKAGRFLPDDPWRRAQAQRWFFQVATDVTSASSWIFNHVQHMPVKDEQNLQWLQGRLARTLAVADQWLAEHEYFADEVSVADFLFYPNFWFRRATIAQSGLYSNLLRWGDQMATRPGVSRGMSIFN